MATGYIIAGLALLMVFAILFIRNSISKTVKVTTVQPVAPNVLAAASLSAAYSPARWWEQLNRAGQLELAIFMAEIALPVWEKYTSSETASYRDTSSLLTTTISHELLAMSLTEIKKSGFLKDGDHQKLNDCYNQFVGPVLALHDGDWMPPYAVKKIFLSFYNILKGLAENNHAGYNDNFFTIAIDHLFDCIDITKLYNREQLNQLILGYKFLR